MEYIGIEKFGSLRANGNAQVIPIRPWFTDNYPGNLSERGKGDITAYAPETEVTIGDTFPSESSKITWVHIKDGLKHIYVCKQVLATNISWDYLNKRNMIYGTLVTIDGKQYKLRVLTGGVERNPDKPGMVPTDNEWDTIIQNTANITGLPKPTTEDLTEANTYGQLDGKHNQHWNWWGINTICQETRTLTSSKITRGYSSAASFTSYDAIALNSACGWRPVLEYMETDPPEKPTIVKPTGTETKPSVTNVQPIQIETTFNNPGGTFKHMDYEIWDIDLNKRVANIRMFKTNDVVSPQVVVGHRYKLMVTHTNTADQISPQATAYFMWGTLNKYKLSEPITISQFEKTKAYSAGQELIMKPQTFPPFEAVDLQLQVGKTNKLTVDEEVSEQTELKMKDSTRAVFPKDTIYTRGKLNNILDVTGNYAEYGVKDATVTNQQHQTFGNGGRKLVKLANGWLVAVMLYNNAGSAAFLPIYYSEDNGTTWKYGLTLKHDTSPTQWGGVSAVARGNDIYILTTSNMETSTSMNINNNARVTKVTLDMFTHREMLWNNYYAGLIDSNGYFGYCSLAINSEGTELHACWSCKTTEHPENYNIRYAKGIISKDGNISWGVIEQITKTIDSLDFFNYPSITLDNNNYVHIITSSYFSRKYLVDLTNNPNVASGMGSVYLANSWKGKLFVVGDSYTQTDPSTVFIPPSISGLSQGRIWVAWDALSESSPTKFNIFVSYSDNGGITWSTPLNISNDTNNSQVYPSITADKTGEIFVLWRGIDSNAPSSGDIRIRKYINNSWGEIETITKNQSSEQRLNYPSTLVDLTLDYTVPLFIYQDDVNKRVGCYGTWQAESSYTLTLENPVTATAGEEISILDFKPKINGQELTTTKLEDNTQYFSIDNLEADHVDLEVVGKANSINTIAYTIS
ncbi:exo-alpha-sialidase [Clostridium botulinum]|uniref:sialidase family protein n=1 Tax=Clostridium botulinum TaxID=1491 RepID=UPI001C9AB2B0|nr:sialidase family protein [Clostridium botulinum]MBY6873006.1 exo-alpha-sialidase [Clostridium botulinum]